MVRTRMAPSPTGQYHIGHIRTLLYNFAFAKKSRGKFIIRVEDTDRERYVDGATEEILKVIRDYGLSWDEGPDIGGLFGPYIQSERLEIYKKYALELVEKGSAYFCFCSKERLAEVRKKCEREHKIPKYDKHCLNIPLEEAKKRASKEQFVIRLKVFDNEVLEYNDLVMGKVSINSKNLDDQVLLKSDGFPTYHLAVVVDDHLMEITHIIRGSEWISSTPKHILLYRYFGWQMPQTAHIPVFLDPSGKGKMSKRKGSVSARGFLEEGYLPEALLNYISLLGWSHPEGRETFSLDEFVSVFDIKDVNKSNPIFDYDKLNYLNGYYIRKMSNEALYRSLIKFDSSLKEVDAKKLIKIIGLEKERLKTLGKFKENTKFFFMDFETDTPTFKALLVPAGRTSKEILDHLTNLVDLFSNIQYWNLENLKKLEEKIRDKAKVSNWKVIDAFSPIRVAITGSLISPPLFESMEILGKDIVISRISDATRVLERKIPN